MGANLVRNALAHGAEVSVFNRTQKTTDEFLQSFPKEAKIQGSKSYKEFVQLIRPPRAILLMVKAGEAVDAVIEELVPLLQKGDLLIDGGNSHYRDTERRTAALKEHGIATLGLGVSGGEEGALKGPSLMPGGDERAYRMVEPLLTAMAAQDGVGGKCVAYLGPEGSGHFVKMVHNGIEYGLMQLIAESYDIFRRVGGWTNAQLAETYRTWSTAEDVGGFLMEITAEIFTQKDEKSGGDLIDTIVDRAGQKGTGKWTTQAAHDYGVAIPTINAAVDARILSGSQEERASGKYFPAALDEQDPVPPPEKLRSIVRHALGLSQLVTYIQGFRLLARASEEEQWNLAMGQVARIWCGGCIIRSPLLELFQAALGEDQRSAKAAKESILAKLSGTAQLDWRRAVTHAQSRGVPVPALSASLAYVDALRADRLPQNLIQAQRDFFGAHGYERRGTEGQFHTQWGDVTPA